MRHFTRKLEFLSVLVDESFSIEKKLFLEGTLVTRLSRLTTREATRIYQFITNNHA